jgi:hypothetical protein
MPNVAGFMFRMQVTESGLTSFCTESGLTIFCTESGIDVFWGSYGFFWLMRSSEKYGSQKLITSDLHISLGNESGWFCKNSRLYTLAGTIKGLVKHPTQHRKLDSTYYLIR